MPEYQVLNSQILLDHPLARVIVDRLKLRDKEQAYFYIQSPVEAVATVGVSDSNELLLTYQYRHPVGRFIYDLPAGRLEPGEDPLLGARREFEEETGFYPEHIEQIGYYNQFPGTLRAGTHLFFASDLHLSKQNLDIGEELEIVKITVAEAVTMILKGEMIDGSLQLGILLALQKGLIKL
jgi:ADP-ribose pyrophosphatase